MLTANSGADGLAAPAMLAAYDAILDAASEPAQWPLALARIAACLGAKGAVLQDQSEDGSFAMVSSPGFEAAIEDYLGGWWRQDIRAARALERNLFVGRGYVTDADVTTSEERLTHPFFTDYMARHGLGPSLGLAAFPTIRIIVSLGIVRPAGAPLFTAAEIAVGQRLARAVEKALRLSLRIFDADSVRETVGHVAGRLGVGVALLDGDHRVVNANATFERLLPPVGPPGNRRIQLAGPEVRDRFDSAVVAALRADPAVSRRPILMPAKSAEGATALPMIIHVQPVESARTAPALMTFQPTARVLVLVIDPNEKRMADPEQLRDLFGLTPAEARLAVHIAAGRGPREAAEALNIQEATARFVLKKVFGKTGLTRQSELAAILGRITLRDD